MFHSFFPQFFLIFCWKIIAFLPPNPKGPAHVVDALEEFPPPSRRLHWGKGLAPVVLLRGSRLGGVNHGEPSSKGEAGEQLHPG